MAMYTSGRPCGGVHGPCPPWARCLVRSPDGLKTSFGAVSLAPDMYRLTVSTPAAMKQSPSPALMAWKAMRIVCRLDEQ